ncbi:MAG: hypothetical protein IJ676_01185 [Clostridia bacterium]|nr:hypothetical protein [Clostridia bacterium]
MPKRPDMSRIEKLFLAGNSFYLSRQQYISYTGADIPQNKSYTQAKSAIAKKAQEYGYSIEVIPEKLVFRKNGT